MAEIHGLREQILANYGFMGFEKPTDEVDVIVRYLDDTYYRASVADKTSGQSILEKDHEAKNVKDALAHLLAHTCAYLGDPPNMIGTGSTQTLPDPGAKRGRGRPKRVLSSAIVKPKAKQAVAAAKLKVATGATRGRGRPRKSDATLTAPTSTVKRGRGRPRKSDVTLTAPTSTTKRAPGRPRKNPVATAPAVADNGIPQDLNTAPAKRGPGRPRKSIATPIAATSATKRSASALGSAQPGTNKSRKTISDEDLLQERISADELGEEAGLTAPFTPAVWFPTYVSRIARVVYHCIAEGPERGLTEDEISRRIGVPLGDVITGIREMSEKNGVVSIEDGTGEMKWAQLNEWDDEDE